jgi:hypothetical protein
MLSNLKQELLEERAHLKRWRRRRNSRRRSATLHRDERDLAPGRSRGVGSDQSIHAMGLAIRHMISIFSRVETPYLAPSVQRRNERRKSHRDDIWSQGEVNYELEEPAEFYDSEYRPCGLKQRFQWIGTKNTVLSLLDSVQRIQIRRIAMQTTEIAL